MNSSKGNRARYGHHFRRRNGQATILFLFCMIAFAAFLGLLINTGKTASRRIEMQGASDSAAMAAGVLTARGMNVMVLNNKGMADLLAAMITVRSMKITAERMPMVLAPIIAGLTAIPDPTGISKKIADQLAKEQGLWGSLASGALRSVDMQINDEGGLGWTLLRQLDQANQQVKSKFLLGLPAEIKRFARANGADQSPYAVAFAVDGSVGPAFPVGRGRPQYIALAADEDGHIDPFRADAKQALRALCDASLTAGPVCLSPFLSWLILDAAIDNSVGTLSGHLRRPAVNQQITVDDLKSIRGTKGDTIADALQSYNRSRKEKAPDFQEKRMEDIFDDIPVSTGGGLGWPRGDPPRPMMLTGEPDPDPQSIIDAADEIVNLFSVHRRLQLLVFARGHVDQPLGAKYFQNEDQNGFLTYAQAQVYNPRDWYMFNQHWQAKLARADLLVEKWPEVASRFGLSASRDDSATDYANTH